MNSSDEDDDDVMEDTPQQNSNHNRGRRTSVSAESMAPTNEPFEKIVIPKTADQKQRIEKSIMNNFLFKTLDEEQYSDVINAMAEKNFGPGEDVIKQGTCTYDSPQAVSVTSSMSLKPVLSMSLSPETEIPL
jgi:cAMP-dependent protein kinase regulator